MPPPSMEKGSARPQPTPAAACSVLPITLRAIMMPQKQIEAQSRASASKG